MKKGLVIQVNLWRWAPELEPARQEVQVMTGAEVRIIIVGRLFHRAVHLTGSTGLPGDELRKLREYGWALIDTSAKWYGEKLMYGRTIFDLNKERTMERIPEHVQMHKVKSSNVEAIGYDDQDNTLYVTYLAKGGSGNSYWYSPIVDTLWQELNAAPSIGGFINAHIKGNPGIKFGKIGDIGGELSKQAPKKKQARR